VSVTDDLLKNNEEYARGFDKGDLPLPPAKGVAVVACMDARLDVHGMLGLELGDAHVIRNAGGVITDDEIRSLAISQRLLGTREIVLIHHTDCGMLTFSDDEVADQIEADTGVRPPCASGWPPPRAGHRRGRSGRSRRGRERAPPARAPARSAAARRGRRRPRLRLRGGDGPAARGHVTSSTSRPTSAGPSRAMRERGTTRSKPAAVARSRVAASTWE